MSVTAILAWLAAKGPVAWAAAAGAGYFGWKAYQEKSGQSRTADFDTVDFHLRELAKAAREKSSQPLVDFVNGFQAEFRKVESGK